MKFDVHRVWVDLGHKIFLLSVKNSFQSYFQLNSHRATVIFREFVCTLNFSRTNWDEQGASFPNAKKSCE